MFKMAIIQTTQEVKTLFLCSIKKLFKLTFNKLFIFITLFLFSCSGYLIQAEEIEPKNLKCGSSSDIGFYKKNGLFTSSHKDFFYKLGRIDRTLEKDTFNFIYISEPKSSGGYTLELLKILKKGNKHHIYLKENEPPEGSANIAAITATYCFLKINTLEKVEVSIK